MLETCTEVLWPRTSVLTLVQVIENKILVRYSPKIIEIECMISKPVADKIWNEKKVNPKKIRIKINKYININKAEQLIMTVWNGKKKNLTHEESQVLYIKRSIIKRQRSSH